MIKIARFLRKLADFIDPRVKPSDAITILIEADASLAINEIGRLVKAEESLKGIQSKMRRFGARKVCDAANKP